jgi:hypothetical protein
LNIGHQELQIIGLWKFLDSFFFFFSALGPIQGLKVQHLFIGNFGTDQKHKKHFLKENTQSQKES